MLKPKQAFTLVEILVTIGAIAVLTGLTTVGFVNARVRAKQHKIVADVLKIQTGLQTYYQRNQTYPTKLTCSEAGDTCLSQDDLGGALPKASDVLDYPYAVNYQFAPAGDSTRTVEYGYPANTSFLDAARLLDQSNGFDVLADANQLQWYAFPTQETGTVGFFSGLVGSVLAVSNPAGGGNFAAQAAKCEFLRGRTYAYRLGTPLLVKSAEAVRDDTPCSDRFYDILGEATN